MTSVLKWGSKKGGKPQGKSMFDFQTYEPSARHICVVHL